MFNGELQNREDKPEEQPSADNKAHKEKQLNHQGH